MNAVNGVIIGLEVHVQLNKLRSKLFCPCSTQYHDSLPNTHVCPTCLGLPGALPRINRSAVECAIKVALALNCDVQEKTLFYRKNYFYPDLPRGFQISQYDFPLASGGTITIDAEDGSEKKVRITRVHMEEDPGRLAYKGAIDAATYSLVDYNRSGMSLLEVVTEPDMNSPKEARRFLNKLRSILEYLDVFDGNLEGAMRVDANISLATGAEVGVDATTGIQKKLEGELLLLIKKPTFKKDGSAECFFKKQLSDRDVKVYTVLHPASVYQLEQIIAGVYGTVSYPLKFSVSEWHDTVKNMLYHDFSVVGNRTEVKNISSYKGVEKALLFEITRQKNLRRRGVKVVQETRHFDEARGVTMSLRMKETEEDYRYFPEPDLVPMKVKDWTASVKLPELPEAKRARFVKQYGISDYHAKVLTSELKLANFFEKVASQVDAKLAATWIADVLKGELNYRDEHFIATCKIAEKPEIVAPDLKELRVQPDLGVTFRPDLTARDKDGRMVLIEVNTDLVDKDDLLRIKRQIEIIRQKYPKESIRMFLAGSSLADDVEDEMGNLGINFCQISVEELIAGKSYDVDLVKPEYMIDMLRMLQSGEITEKGAVEVIRTLLDEGGTPRKIIERKGLSKVGKDEVDGAIEEVLRENQKAVTDYEEGKKEALNFIVGQVMKKTRGRVDAAYVQKGLGAQDFRDELYRIFAEAHRQGKPYVDVKSSELHERVGVYPKPDHRMPVCCGVMWGEMKSGDEVLYKPPSGQGAKLAIRYKLPR